MVVWKLHVDLPGTGVIKENWLERASPRERGVIRIEFIYFCVSGFYDYLLFCFDKFVGEYVFVCFGVCLCVGMCLLELYVENWKETEGKRRYPRGL